MVKTELAQPVRDALFELTMTYLLEQPTNVKKHARKFFQRMEQSRRTIIISDESSSSSSDESMIAKLHASQSQERRRNIVGESYDPSADTEEFIKPVYHKTKEEREVLEQVAKKTFLFRNLDEEQLEDVINAMFKRETEPGDVIIRQGDNGDNFYVIEHGYFDVFLKKPGEDEAGLVFSYENEGHFGELALLYNQPRAATVIAKTKGVIWALDRVTFRKLVMHSAYEKRAMYENFIKTVPILSHLGSYERLNIADVLVPKKCQKEDLIIKQGEDADGMYFVEKGRVSVRILHKGGEEIELTQIQAGGYFGELALVTRKSRIASVYAAEDSTRLAFLDREAFERFMGPCMMVMKENIGHYRGIIRKLLGSREAIILDEVIPT